MQPNHWFEPTDRMFCMDTKGTLKVHPRHVCCDVCRSRSDKVVVTLPIPPRPRTPEQQLRDIA